MTITARGLRLDDWNKLLQQASQIDFNTGTHKYIGLHTPTKSYRIVSLEAFSPKDSDYQKLSYGHIVSKTQKMLKKLPQDNETAKKTCESLMKLTMWQKEKLSIKKRFILCRIWKQFCEVVYHFFKCQGLRTSVEVASRCARRFIGLEPVLMKTETEWMQQLSHFHRKNRDSIVAQNVLNEFSSSLEQGYCSAQLGLKAVEMFPNTASDQVLLCAQEEKGFSLNPSSYFNLFRLELLLKSFGDDQIQSLFRGLFNRPNPSSKLFFDVICAVGSVYQNQPAVDQKNHPDRVAEILTYLICIAVEQDRIGELIHYAIFVPIARRLWGEERVQEWNRQFACAYIKHALFNEGNSALYERMLKHLGENNVELLELAIEKKGWDKYYTKDDGKKIENWCHTHFISYMLSCDIA